MVTSSTHAAYLTVQMLRAFEKEHGKEISRFKMTKRTLRHLAARGSLRGAFIEDWEAEMADLGWIVFEIDDSFGLVRHQIVNSSWPRIASKRIDRLVQRVRRGEPDAISEISEGMIESESAEDD